MPGDNRKTVREKREGEFPPGIAVVGSGYWGKNLIRNYSRIGALRVICDRDEGILSGFRKQYGEIDACTSLDEVLSRKDVAGIVVATPAETHYALGKRILAAGKHVYIEKPLVLKERHGKELIRLAAEKGLVLMVGHLLQYHPAFILLKEMVSSGQLGRINYICSNRLNFGKIRREENILWSFAPHDISMILSLAGEEPEAVYAIGANYLHQKIADVTTTHLEFPSGIKAHIFVSWLHPYKEQNLIVVGDEKMAVFNDTLPWDRKLCLYPHRIRWEGNMPVPERGEPRYPAVEEGEPLHAECRHFLDCISTGDTPRTDGLEGLRVLRILKASQDSLDACGKKIEISPDESWVGGAAHMERDGSFVHPSSIVDDNVVIGGSTRIWHFCHVLPGSRIGSRCTIGQNVVIGPDVTIGNRCKIQNNISVYKGVILEDGVFCGPSMVFTNVYNPRAEMRKMDQVRETRVRRGATIGANATIICGVTIGRYAFVGGGAVVARDVPDYALVVGNPARRIGWVCRCGERLSPALECPVCGARYREREDTIEEIEAPFSPVNS